MELYVCWNTRPGFRNSHPCGKAYGALVDAGWSPTVHVAKGFGFLPFGLGGNSPERQEVRRLTGQSKVPVLVLDSGETITSSKAIVEWACANPATVAPRA